MLVVEAYIFINSDPRMLWKITEAALKIQGVKTAHTVTGQFDVVAHSEFTNMDAVRGIIDNSPFPWFNVRCRLG